MGASAAFGHRLRTLKPADLAAAASLEPVQVEVAIVGGGVAGLSAARRLQAEGVEDLLLLELEQRAGGNSQSGESSVSAFPLGAHYLPSPRKENQPLVEFLDSLGAFEGFDDAGEPIPQEHWLVRDPESRVFYKGTWYDGLYLYAGASEEDLAQRARFETQIDHWTGWRDAEGRRAFTLPVSACSSDPHVMRLDQISMREWMDQQQLTSSRLRWYVDYACRDDYGLRLESTSAWAGLFYFASRRQSPGGGSQPFLTWPEGNGFLVQQMIEPLKERLETGWAVCSLQHLDAEGKPLREPLVETAASREVELIAMSLDGQLRRVLAKRVVFAAQQFLAPRLIRRFPDDRVQASRAFPYGPWAVVNLHVDQRPGGEGFPLCWDNVFYESPSLGYVTATHQRGPEYGPTVLTYYYPLCGEDRTAERQRLLDSSREDWAEVALSDLEASHKSIRDDCVKADVARWGHAMVCPTPGFVGSEARRLAAEPFGRIHFAHSDLSGVSLFEEAFDHGWRAAGEILAAREQVG